MVPAAKGATGNVDVECFASERTTTKQLPQKRLWNQRISNVQK